jgi:alanyl-tRNA synthetase
MFFDSGKPFCKKGPGREYKKNCNPSCDCGKFVEIWNDVFMQYNKTEKGKFELLQQKNVDTGMGLERTVAVLEGKSSNFETDLLKPVFDAVQKVSKNHAEKTVVSQRIITDHLRSAVFILGDEQGIVPSNTDQGYVLRRLIRRAIRHAKLVGIEKNFCSEIGKIVLDRYQETYPELKKNRQRVLEELEKEETKFKNTLENGMRLLQREIESAKKQRKKQLDEKTVFDLYQSFGFPLEMTQEIAVENQLSVDEKAFNQRLQEHQALSKKGAEQRFSGGLADHSEEVIRLHTATHLLNAALQRVLGKHVHQRGSNITKERLRFDFPHPQKMTPNEIQKVEEWVNHKISEGLEVKFEMLPLKEALKLGAMAEFGEKYADTVKVYSIWNPKTKEVFSRELCGGPHVKNTKEIGHFKIIKEEAVAAGIRRIKAVAQ